MIHRTLPLLLASLLFRIASTSAADSDAWEIWDNCRLEADQYFDGDSFHVKHGRSTDIIRLYFVDAPESDDSYPARVAEQAAHFRASNAAVLHAGHTAKELTLHFLAQPFRVITRRQLAPGASRSDRYYGIVEKDGRRLDATLVTAGLARVSSEIAEYPDAAAGHRAVGDLRAFERKAAEMRRGLWLRTGFTESLHDATKPRTGTASASPARRIDLNTGSTAELESLPGIGPKMAEQIIRARPLKNIEALDAIPGMGPKKIEVLRELVSF